MKCSVVSSYSDVARTDNFVPGARAGSGGAYECAYSLRLLRQTRLHALHAEFAGAAARAAAALPAARSATSAAAAAMLMRVSSPYE